MAQGRRARRTSARAAAALASVLAATLVLGLVPGCSSDGDSTSRPTPTRTAGDRSGTYLALGDSYVQGYQPAPDGGSADYRNGYAYLVPDRAADLGWDLDLVNLGCGGARVASMQDDDGCAEQSRAPDGPVYDEPQLDAAVAYLEDHPGEVALITLSIGGNDITRCARGAADPIACVTDAVEVVQEGLAEILPTLREAAGPDTTIIGLTYPDVILGSYVLGEAARPLAELSVVAFRQFINPMLRTAYEAIDARFVDVTEATGAYTPLTETTTLEPYGEVPKAVAEVCELTWFCERQDIHPRDAGYELIADLVVKALPSA